MARDIRPTAKAASEARTWRSTRSEVGRRPSPGRSARWRTLGQRQRQLERGQLVGRGVAGAGERGRLDRGGPGRVRVVADQPVPGHGRRRAAQARREGGVVAGPGDRQQVARDGPPDRCVPERDRPSPVSTRNPFASASLPAGPQVGVERRRRPSRGPVTERGAERVVSTSNAAATAASWSAAERAVGQRQQAQDPAAFLRADRQAGDDQLVERAGQRGARQLAAGGEQLLGDERQAARTARRRAAAGWPTPVRPRSPR